jgi:hypothetical protein
MKNFCVISMLALLMPLTHAVAAWQVTTFEVYQGVPVKATDSREQEDPDNPGPDIAPIVSCSITGSFLSASP